MSALKTRLKAVNPKAAEPSKPKVLIFGREGIGKTWFALQFPSVYFIDVESGASRDHYTDMLERSGGVYMGLDQGSLDFETVIEQIQALSVEKHPYRTVVIDSVTKLFNTAVANEAERLGDKNAFGADKRPATQYMRRLVAWLSRIDLNVVLTAHQVDVWGLNDKGIREVIGVGPDCWAKLPYELDLSINIQKAGGRRIGKVGKSRLIGFPEASTFEFTYDEFAQRYGRDVIERNSTPLNLASEEQVAEINLLLNTVKLPEGQAEKWLAAASADTWSELDEEKAIKVINALKAKLIV